jgi:dimeric dUTPase (all-alpha-NTP-PPase superfamily)
MPANSAVKDDMKSLIQSLYTQEPLDLALGLSFLANVQAVVSKSVQDAIPEINELPSKDSIRTYVLAMIVELAEFVQTLDWKPWKNKRDIDYARVLDEFADVLAFQGILILYMNRMGLASMDIAEAYNRKSIVNMQRFLGEHGNEYVQNSLIGE